MNWCQNGVNGLKMAFSTVENGQFGDEKSELISPLSGLLFRVLDISGIFRYNKHN